jgi:hypothetical protein
MRQASIGIRRTPPSTAPRSVTQQPNTSKQRLNAPLPALDEDCALGQVSSNSSESTLTEPEPDHSRLRKVKSAVQTRLPFWSNKEKEKQKTPATNASAVQPGNLSMDYTSDMVDVLDTIGMPRLSQCSWTS